MLEDEQHAPFIDGALWYLGEVLRRTSALPWRFVRGETSDPAVGNIDTLEFLTGGLTAVDRGSLRRRYDRVTASP